MPEIRDWILVGLVLIGAAWAVWRDIKDMRAASSATKEEK